MSKLKPCPDCGHKISSKAASCPNCGRPLSASAPMAYRAAQSLVIIVASLMVVGVLYGLATQPGALSKRFDYLESQ